jgi:hypothetical protein
MNQIPEDTRSHRINPIPQYPKPTMSEYQFYEFQAIDRPLTPEDQRYIHSLSSRVKLAGGNAQFTYSYGDFRGKVEDVLERCFDMMVYVANFGVRQLLIRLPRAIVDPKTFAPYCAEDGISVTTTKKSVILNINLVREDYYAWIDDEEDYLTELLPLREELLQGDLRVLYLAWLASGFAEDMSAGLEEFIEPPVPAGLKKLSPALQSFAELFVVDQDLIAIASESSTALQPAVAEPFADWIAALSDKERKAYLLRLVEGDVQVGAELKLHLRQKFGKVQKSAGESMGRTLADMVAIAKEKKTQRDRKIQQTAAKARQKYLKDLIPKVDQIWREVDRLIECKQPKYYDEAVAHLVDLRDLAESQGSLSIFQECVQSLQQKYSSRPALISRLRKLN